MTDPVITPIDPGRAVDEWIGSHPDAAIPKRVKVRILLRYGGRCYRTGHKFRSGDRIEFDHIIALCNGGEHREKNIAPILGGKVHQGKTAADRKTKSKTESVTAKHFGLDERPARGFRRPAGMKFDWSRGRYVKAEG